jgi:MFS family permease
MAVAPARSATDFNKLWFGQTVSAFGDKISRIALPTIAILVLDGGAFNVGVLAALGAAPFLFLSPFAGVWVDRLSRRNILIVTDVGRLLVMGTVPVAYWLDVLTMPQLYAVALVTGILTVFFQIAYQSYLPSLVNHEQLVGANGKLQTSTALADVGGAAIGGALIQAIGTALAVIADALTFLVSVLSLIFIRHREERPERPADAPQRHVLHEMREGLSALLADPRLRSLMLGTGLVNLGNGLANAILLLFAYRSADLSPGQVGIAFAAGGIGLVVGAILANKIGGVLGVGTAMVLSVALSGVAFLGIASAGTGVGALVVLAAGQFFLGATTSVYHIHTISIVQGITPPQLLGRVNGSALTVVFGAGAVGAMLGGIVGAAVGVRGGIVIGGVVVILGGLLLLASPIRTTRSTPMGPGGPGGPPPADAEAASPVDAEGAPTEPATTTGVTQNGGAPAEPATAAGVSRNGGAPAEPATPAGVTHAEPAQRSAP